MDTVREEVLTIMQDSMQKTASFCASLCAERIVAARRELQHRWAAERQELERLYSLPSGGSTAANAASLATPLSTGFLPFVSPTAFVGVGGGGENSPSRAPSFLNGGPPSESYDATFIDAYDAVQTLEERTNMAARAMDLLDEALQTAAGAGGGPALLSARGTRPASSLAAAAVAQPLEAELAKRSGDQFAAREPYLAGLSAMPSTSFVQTPVDEKPGPWQASAAFASTAPQLSWDRGIAAAASSPPAPPIVAREPLAATATGAMLGSPHRGDYSLPPIGDDKPLPTLEELAAGTSLPVFEERGGHAVLSDRRNGFASREPAVAAGPGGRSIGAAATSGGGGPRPSSMPLLAQQRQGSAASLDSGFASVAAAADLHGG